MIRALIAAAMFALSAQAACAQTPTVRLVFFTADWCPNCRVLEPELARAVSRVSGAERVDVDATDARSQAESAARAERLGLARLYADYAGKTGFAAIVAADTLEPIACITASFAAPEIEAELRRAITRVRTRPPLSRATDRAAACPKPAAHAPARPG